MDQRPQHHSARREPNEPSTTRWPTAAAPEPELGLGGDHVPRPRLVSLLMETAASPLILIAAPAGYGKTAVVKEWARSDRRRFLWLTVDEDDNDAERFIGRVGAVLQPALSAAVSGPAGRVSLAGAPEEREPFVLVLDGIDALHAALALEVLQRLIDRVPRPSQLILIARRAPELPLARLRAQRVLTEVGIHDLALTRSEAGALLTSCGVALKRRAQERLMAKAEGWPAALYLAAVSLRQFPAASSPPQRFGGDDGLMSDYIREEILASLDEEQRNFMLRASVLDRLSGPACDA